MPLVISFLVPLLLICLFAAVAIPFGILFLAGLVKRRRWMKWVGGIPAATILLIALCAFGFLIYGFIHPWSDTTDPKTIRASFRSNFGFEAGPDVVLLNQRISGLADSMSIHLQFKASSNTVERIRAMAFEPSTALGFNASVGRDVPPWWVKNPSGVFYENPNWKGQLASSHAYLNYDPSTRLVFFYVISID